MISLRTLIAALVGMLIPATFSLRDTPPGTCIVGGRPIVIEGVLKYCAEASSWTQID
jgi:hypothetical protein